MILGNSGDCALMVGPLNCSKIFSAVSGKNGRNASAIFINEVRDVDPMTILDNVLFTSDNDCCQGRSLSIYASSPAIALQISDIASLNRNDSMNG